MRVLLCSRTREYRRVAATLFPPAQHWVVEVGCHEGITTGLLAQRWSGRVLGLDRSPHAIRLAVERSPALHFEVFDIEAGWSMLDSFLGRRGAAATDVWASFVDLGGDARLSAVLDALSKLRSLPNLKLMVVKSEELVQLKRNSEHARE
mmetsp:Transcript_161/g.379  ORF Transcript_161/g.379 Transcript_161/m.379 type:complete len:149 (+) Transcript_161:41-487(+)